MQSERATVAIASASTTSAAVATSSCFYSYLYQRINPFSLFITTGMYLRVPLLAHPLAGSLAVNTPGVY